MKNQILLLSIVLTGIGACTQDNKDNRTAIEKLEDFQGQYIDDVIRLDTVIFAEVSGSAINPEKKLKTARLAYSLFDIKDLDHPIKEFREIYTEKLLLRTLNLHEEVNNLLVREDRFSEVVLVYKYGNRGDVATVRFERNIYNSYGYVETVSEWAEDAEILVDKALKAKRLPRFVRDHAFSTAYRLSRQAGYRKSKSDFKRLLETDAEALNDLFKLHLQDGLEDGGEKISIEEYSKILGLGDGRRP